jgi:hypothetical protein
MKIIKRSYMFKENYGNRIAKPHYVVLICVNDNKKFNVEDPQIMHCI